MMKELHSLISKLKQRLAIIVPYRDRAQHLAKFIPHIEAYFERDKIDMHIPYSIHIVEQSEDKDFNRGKLCNCGVDISKSQADYFCFHDVDYMPIWADYSYCVCPTHLIWHGLEPANHFDNFFGAVTMLNKNDFFKVNGFSNEYWGWGYEDVELRERCVLAGMTLQRRFGTYNGLQHESAGRNRDGSPKPVWTKNKTLFQKRKNTLEEMYGTEGLSSLDYTLNKTEKFKLGSKTYKNVFFHQVEI